MTLKVSRTTRIEFDDAAEVECEVSWIMEICFSVILKLERMRGWAPHRTPNGTERTHKMEQGVELNHAQIKVEVLCNVER